MKQFLSISRPLRLGIPVVLNEFYWLDLYFELKKQFPDLEFQTTNRTVPLLLSMLRDSSLDAVLGHARCAGSRSEEPEAAYQLPQIRHHVPLPSPGRKRPGFL